MKENKFFIICPSYNNENWVEKHIGSILKQTYTNYSVLYIDDFSTDNTYEKVISLVKDNKRFKIIRNDENKGAAYNYVEHLDLVNADDIIVHLDGDDWLFNNNVLKKLNDFYNENDLWMTYGRFVYYDGTPNIKPSDFYGLPHSDFIVDNKLFRKDHFRASHLRTYKGFLFKSIDKKDMISKITNEYYWHAIDVAWATPALEMCPKEKVGVPDFFTCVYNKTPSNWQRSEERQRPENHKFEVEIRNQKMYKEGLTGEKLPQVNVFGDYREKNSIPKSFSYVYNLQNGEFDVTLLQDYNIIRYLNGEFKVNRGKIVADVHEPRHLLNHNQVYETLKNNASKFDLILTYDDELLKLPNAKFRNGGYEVVLNKSVHTLEYPNIANDSLIKIYKEKNKNVSFITSSKNTTEGHKYRLEILNYLKSLKFNNIDVFGNGINNIVGKIEGLRDYKFSITMENGISKNYFTEKILDCFLTGTIPIYWGCPNISDFFDDRGIIRFNNKEELNDILNNLKEEDYISMLEYVNNNFETAKKYWLTNDRLFNKYLKDII